MHRAPFGVFLRLGIGHVHAVLEIGCFADASATNSELSSSLGPRPALRYPDVGEVVTATVLGYREDNHQIYVSAKPTPSEA